MADSLDHRKLAQHIFRPFHLAFGTENVIRFDYVRRVVAQRRVDQMVDLELHRQRGGDHGDRDHILERDEDLAEHHLRLPAERPAYHVDRFGR